MKSPVWAQEYVVNSTLVRPGGRIGLTGLLGLLQDTAWTHATDLGHGYERMLERGSYWVITRQRLRMREWPRLGDRLQVQTWVRPLQGAVALRDSEISVEGRIIGECVTSCLSVDASTGQVAQMPLDSAEMVYRSDRCLSFEPRKVQVVGGLEPLACFAVRNSDLDVNEHVNNTRYAQWVLDSVPLQTHRAYRLDDYEVNFLAETRVGDVIRLTRGELAPQAEGPRRFQFQGERESDGKVVFSASLAVTPRVELEVRAG